MDSTQSVPIVDQMLSVEVPDEIMVEKELKISPQGILRDEKGQITQGVAQDTNKNGTAGRPCLLCQRQKEIISKTQKYFEDCFTKMRMPFFEELALMLDFDDETLSIWAKKKTLETNELEHPEFSAYISKLKTLQKLRLQQRVLGKFNPTGALSLLRWHHGMIEAQKNIIAGEKDDILKIEIVEEKKYE